MTRGQLHRFLRKLTAALEAQEAQGLIDYITSSIKVTSGIMVTSGVKVTSGIWQFSVHLQDFINCELRGFFSLQLHFGTMSDLCTCLGVIP